MEELYSSARSANKHQRHIKWLQFNRNVYIVLLLNLMIAFREQVNCNASSERRPSARVVTTKYGTLRGFIVTLPNKSLQAVEVFLGVPYASPPTGKLRFMPPVTPAHWNNIRNVHQPGPVCPQKLPDIRNETLALQRMTHGRLNILKRVLPMLQNQSEDCLYLNIYTPVANQGAHRLPVMMFIHGESYEWNAGSNYDGSVLSSLANVVVVTINFRIGVLGFFPALDGTSRGNFGLMDQVAALHWIQENIAEFGGDASNVTIFGQGFGAACVNLLMLSPMAKGLFHRAIMQSGSALSPWAVATDAGKYSKQLAQQLGCLTNKSEKNSAIVNCLRQKSVNELLSVKFKVPTHLISFGPTIDGIVIPNDPSVLMADSHSLYGNYDLMFGIAKAEAFTYFTTHDERQGIDANRRDRILRTVVRNLFNFHLQEIFLTIANEYTDWSRPMITPLSIFESVSDALSDALVTAGTIKSGLLHSKNQRNTYFYHFAHSTEMDDYHWRIGSTHGEDLMYVFGAPLVSGTPLGFFIGNYTKTEIALSENVINYWSNFARNGYAMSGDACLPTVCYTAFFTAFHSTRDPNNNANPALDASNNLAKSKTETKLWQRYEEQQQYYLMLTTKPKIKDHYQSHRLSYWLNLIPRIHVPGVSSAFEHHLLEDFDNPVNYEGIVREMTAAESLLANQHNPRENSNSYDKSASDSHSSFSAVNTFGNNISAKTSVSALWPIDNLNVNGVFDDEKDINNYLNGSFSMIVQETTYSTALSVTIAIGCSLLVLNILVFAGVFYHRDRGANETDDSNKTFERNVDPNRMPNNKYQSLHSPAKISDRSPSVKQNSLCSGHCVTAIRAMNVTDKNCIGQPFSTSSSPSCHRFMTGSTSTSCNCPLVNCAYATACNCQVLALSTLKPNCKLNDYNKLVIDETEIVTEIPLPVNDQLSV